MIDPSDRALLSQLSPTARMTLWSGMAGSFQDFHAPLDQLAEDGFRLGELLTTELERLVNLDCGYELAPEMSETAKEG